MEKRIKRILELAKKYKGERISFDLFPRHEMLINININGVDYRVKHLPEDEKLIDYLVAKAGIEDCLVEPRYSKIIENVDGKEYQIDISAMKTIDLDTVILKIKWN